jgi:hypothetical protein
VNDVNLLTYGISAEKNCRNLKKIHDAYEDWARRHNSKFNFKKYELLYLIQTPKKYNTETSDKIEVKKVRPAQNIRILRVKVNLTLK